MPLFFTSKQEEIMLKYSVKLNLKLFLRTPVFWLLPVPIGVYMGMMLAEYQTATTAVGIFNCAVVFMSQCATLVTAYMLFVGYEYVSKSKDSSLDETLTYLHGDRTTWVGQLLVMSVLLIAMCALTGLLTIWYAVTHIGYSLWLVKNLSTALILYVLCPGCIGLLCGTVLALMCKRSVFYIFSFVFVFLLSPLSSVVLNAFGFFVGNIFGLNVGVAITKIIGFVSEMRPVTNHIVDLSYGVGTEIYHWELILCWLSVLACAIVVYFLNKKVYKYTASAVLLASALFFLAGYWNSGSNWQEELHPTIADIQYEDSLYYGKHTANLQNADFSVVSYDMKLHFGKQMNAEVSIVTDNSCEQYTFTLYHNYKIKSVLNENGEKIKFSQQGDYFTVWTNDKSFTVVYSGFHDVFYANNQGVYLPGYFCWYPMPGKVAIYQNGSYITTNALQNDALFTLRCDEQLYSNLDILNDVLTGNAKTCTLLKGNYRRCNAYSLDMVLPAYDNAPDLLAGTDAVLYQIGQETGLDLQIRVETAFLTHNVNFPAAGIPCVALDNYLLYCCNQQVGDNGSINNQDVVAAVLQNYFGNDTILASHATNMLKGYLYGNTPYDYLMSVVGDVSSAETYSYINIMSEQDNYQREMCFWLSKALQHGMTPKQLFEKIQLCLQDVKQDQLEFVKSMAKEAQQ